MERAVPRTGLDGVPLLDRDAELAALADRVGAADAGSRGALVAGAPGIGKTRLLVELAARMRASGWRVVWGRSWEVGGAPAFWPWTQVVRDLLGRPGATELAAAVLDDPDDAERFELFEATARVVRRAAEAAPVLILLDDLHAADVPTLQLTRFVVGQLGDARADLVAAYRPRDAVAHPEVEGHLAALARDGGELVLGGLGVAAVGALVGDGVPAEEVHAVTGGNPLFVEQVVRQRAGRGSAELLDGLDADPLRGAIRTRLEQVDGAARELLLGVAVLGEAATADELAALLRSGADTIRVGLGLLVDAGLVRSTDGGAAAPAHGLVADVALGRAEAEHVAWLHLRAADMIGDDRARIGAKARHLLRAGPAHRTRAIEASVQAADAAEAATAHEDAADHLERALRAFDGAPELDGTAHARQHLDLLLALGRAQRHADRVEAAATSFDRAYELAVSLGDADGSAQVALRGGVEYYFAGDADAVATDRCRVALGELPSGDSATRARLLATLAVRGGPTPEHGRHDAAAAVAMARRVGDPVALGTALVAQQRCTLGPGSLAQRIETVHEVLALARTTREPTLAVQGRYLLLASSLERGDLRGLDSELAVGTDRTGHLADRHRARLGRWFAFLRAVFDGRIAHAEELAEQSLAIAIEHDDPAGPSIYGAQLGTVRWLQGRAIELEPLFESQWRASPDEPVWPAVLAHLWASEARLDAARGAIAAVDLDEVPDGMHWLLTTTMLAEATVAVGDDDLAVVLRERLLPFADRFVPVNAGAGAWGTVARPLALLAGLLDRDDEVVAHLERAIAVCARLGAWPWLVEAQLDLVDVLAARDPVDRARVRELAEEVVATADQIGLPRFAARADAARARAGATRTGGRPAPVVTGPRISVLGAFEVVSTDGRIARWNSRKARELLKILVSHRGGPVHREVLMDLLWPGVDPAALGNRLSVALSTVRRALDPDRTNPAGAFVVADRDSVRLDLDAVDVDLERFLTAAEQAIAAHHDARPEAPELLATALRAHPGPALPDEPYADWAAPVQGEVRVAFLRVARAAADRAVERGDDLTAADAFRRVVEVDPFDDEGRGALLAALERLGGRLAPSR